MDKNTDEQIKDNILMYLASAVVVSAPEQIAEGIGLGLIGETKVAYLLKEMENYPIKFYSISNKGVFLPDKRTIFGFLDNGGFTKIELNNREQRKSFLEMQELEKQLALSNLKANQRNEKTARTNRHHYRINMSVTLFNALVLIWSILHAYCII